MTPHDELPFDEHGPIPPYLLDKLWAICDQQRWKYDDPKTGESPFKFWPWGEAEEPVLAASAALIQSGPSVNRTIGYLILSAGRGGLPMDLVRQRLPELMRHCARNGVSLTVGSEATNIPRPGRWVNAALSFVITATSLSGPALEEAVALLYSARNDLAEFCRRSTRDP
jgi:hypothetical protein